MKKKTVLLTICFTLLISIVTAYTQTCGTPNNINQTATTGSNAAGDHYAFYQTFTPDCNGTIDHITVWNTNLNSETATIFITQGANPIGSTILDQFTFTFPTSPSTSPFPSIETDIPLSNTINLLAGVTYAYAMVFNQGDNISFDLSSGDQYSDGEVFWVDEGSTTWEQVPTNTGETGVTDMRFRIRWVDQSPYVTCRENRSFALDANGTRTITFGQVSNGSGASAGESVVIRSINPSFFDCDDVGPQSVTLSIQDTSGQNEVCTTTVFITDGQDPVLTCPDDIILALPVGDTEGAVTYDIPTVVDCTAETPAGFTHLGVYTDPDGDIRNYYLSDDTIAVENGFNEAFDAGGNLVTVIDQEHNDWLRESINFVTGATNVQVLLGYTDRFIEGSFLWYAGSENDGYENWNTGEPNNFGNEDYTVMIPNGRWNDLAGTQQRRFLLQIEGQSSEATLISGIASGGIFPIGTTTNMFEVTDAYGNIATCSFDVTIEETIAETTVILFSDGGLVISDTQTPNDLQLTLSNDDTTLTISGLISPNVIGATLLADQTTVTVPLSSITSGITIIGTDGQDNDVTFANALTLSGASNDIGISNFQIDTQNLPITVGGTFIVIQPSGVLTGDTTINGAIDFDFDGNFTPNVTGDTSDNFDQLVVNGTVSITNGNFTPQGGFTAQTNETEILLINNDGTDAISGTFNGLPEGSTVIFGDYEGVLSYIGGDGNDLSLFRDVTPPMISCPEDVVIDCADVRITSMTGTSTEIVDIPDNDQTGINSTLTLSNLIPDNHIITDMTVEISMDHTWVGDLTFELIAPNGETLIVYTRPSGFGDNSNLEGDFPITFTDDATTSADNIGVGIDTAGTICQASESPCEYFPSAGANGFEQFIATLNATNTDFNGDWTLHVTDDQGGDSGTLNTWSIHFISLDLNNTSPPIIDTTPVSTGMATATDAIGNTTVAFSDVVVDGCGISETITRTWTATDESGNMSTCIQTITVTDTRAPELTSCPEDIIFELASGDTEAIITYDLPEATDLCGDVTITQTEGIASGELFPEGVTTNTFSITDVCGNEVICSFTVTVTAQETLVSLNAGVLTIEDVGSTSDDSITLSDDGNTLTISNLTFPVDIEGAVTEISDTSVTVALVDITNGIVITTDGGTNTVTVGASTATAINIQGDNTATIALDAIDTGSLSIAGFTEITDVGSVITVTGATNLTSSGEIDINNGQGSHEFGGLVTLSATRITITAGADLTFNEVTITASDSFVNSLITSPGILTLDGNVNITNENTNLILFGSDGIFQQSGIINRGFLRLSGDGSGEAILDQVNTVGAIAAENPDIATESAFTNLSFTNATNAFLADIIVDEFTLTAPQFDLEPGFTLITKNGTSVSTFNADMDINNGTGTAIFNHNAGTINFNGDTNDFNGRVTYNGSAGTITNFNSDFTDLPVGGPDRSFTFGFLNNTTGTIDIGDLSVDILNEANFFGANTLMTGFPFLNGGPTTISDNATISPGGGTFGLRYNFDDLIINTGATFAPYIVGDNTFDSLEAENVTLNDANLAPTGGFIAQTAGELIIVNNTGTNPVSGTFNGFPEGASISFGNYNGIISYVGGDGNDISISPDPDNLTTVLISEYQPLFSPSSDPQTIEIFGAAGSVFEGTFVVIEGDYDNDPGPGTVVGADTFSGTFDANGLLTATIPNINNPTHTVVLTTSFTGTVDTGMDDGTDIDMDNDGVADDLSAFGLILDAVGVGDGGICCPEDFLYGTDFGCIDLPSIGSIPGAIFRDASDGDFFQISDTSGNIFDNTGATIDASLFDTTPTEDGTFGAINPTTASKVVVSATVYLQGAFTNPNASEESLMRDDLRVANLVPLATPYTDGKTINASVLNTTGANAVVDWVFVELRDATDNSIVIDGQSALLLRNGSVVDTDGTSSLSFEQDEDSYHVAINHRNHLGVITANTVALSSMTTSLDFSSDIAIANGGTLALRDMGNGIFAIYAGDATGDGNILNTDITNTINVSGGINTYDGADANMDGNILNDDIALFIQRNAGRIQQF
ncbi:HYR domain-containing protein [Dokdonia sp.]|uniref:HYR domain-containing protein n=1 Tax=Dokdonia sp. TaxID=2024995 RepID=UPI0032677D4B